MGPDDGWLLGAAAAGFSRNLAMIGMELGRRNNLPWTFS